MIRFKNFFASLLNNPKGLSCGFILAFMLFIPAVVSSQGIKFTASLDRTRVSMNGNFKLSFTVENGDPKDFQPPSFKDFHLLFGPSTSSNYQFVNGKTSRSMTYSYTLQPKAVGKFTFGPAKAKVKGKIVESNRVTIEVVKGHTHQHRPINQNQQQQTEQFNIDENVFIRVITDKTNVYQGEQIIVTYKIYTRMNIVNYELNKMPSNTGFWSQNIEGYEQIHLRNEVLNNIEYRVGILKREALFPQRDGTLEIDPMEMKVIIRVQDNSRRRRSMFDNFFGGYRDITRVLKSNGVKIKVKPFPEVKKPADFNGAVGSYKMEVTLDKTETKANDPITIRAKISGRGNIKMITPPKVRLPPNFEVYDPKITESISSNNNVVRGAKTFEYLAIPRLPGEYKLPAIKFSYFDLTKKEYVTLSSSVYMINVSKDESAPGIPTISGITKEDVELIGEDIRFIKTKKANLVKHGKTLYGSAIFFMLLGLPFLLFGGLVSYLKRYQKLRSNVALLKTRRANKLARKRLSKAKVHLKQNERKEFYDEIARAVWGYLGDKLNIPTAELSKDKAEEVFKAREIDETLLQKVTDTLDACEMALFSPSGNEGEMGNTYRDTINLIAKLEANIK